MKKLQARPWGKLVNPMLTSAPLFSTPRATYAVLMPIYMAAEAARGGWFTREQSDAILRLVNIVRADAAQKNKTMWTAATQLGDLVANKRIKERDSVNAEIWPIHVWNWTPAECAELSKGVLRLDQYLRMWTARRFTIASMTSDALLDKQGKNHG